MDMEAKVAEAICSELERQAAEAGDRLAVSRGEGGMSINGLVDVEALAMAVVGAIAGGP